MSLNYSVCLRLADGSEWSLTCSESPAKEIVEQLARTMNLNPGIKAQNDVLVTMDPGQEPNKGQVKIHALNQVLIGLVSAIQPSPNASTQNLLMSVVGTTLGYLIQQDQGVLLHAALAERQGCGVLFAGPGGVGKSTTSRRLPLGWRSLSDDASLVIEHQGVFYAHPWPTWSRFFIDGGMSDQWDVQEFVPVKAIFLLDRSKKNYLEGINQAEAAVSLVKSNEQIINSQIQVLNREQRIKLRMQVFETISKLVRTVPVRRLCLGLDDDFGPLLEDFLAGVGWHGPLEAGA